MIDCAFLVADARTVGVDAFGHAEFAKLGRDVVCAAVSTLLQTLWLGLTEIADVRVSGGWESGDLHLRWSAADAERIEVAVLIATTKRALEALAAQYPRNLAVR